METQSNNLFVNTYPYAPFVSCKVHPVVVFNILDHYIRRDEKADRVFGTLLGVYQYDGTVEIRNSFPLKSLKNKETKEPVLEEGFQQQMLDLHQQVSPNELVVGWYSTGSDIQAYSSNLNESFEPKDPTQNPLLLMVDTNFTDLRLSVKAYSTFKVLFNNTYLGLQFLPIGVEVKPLETDKIGLNLLVKARDSENGKTNLIPDLKQLASSVGKLNELLDSILDYVTKVTEGKIQGDPKIGRFLTDALASLPKIDQQSLEKMFTNSVQDLLMVVYLADLTRTQLALAEKAQRNA